MSQGIQSGLPAQHFIQEIKEEERRNPDEKNFSQPNDSALYSYFSNFTIHGLARVFIGKLWERLICCVRNIAALHKTQNKIEPTMTSRTCFVSLSYILSKIHSIKSLRKHT